MQIQPTTLNRSKLPIGKFKKQFTHKAAVRISTPATSAADPHLCLSYLFESLYGQLAPAQPCCEAPLHQNSSLINNLSHELCSIPDCEQRMADFLSDHQ